MGIRVVRAFCQEEKEEEEFLEKKSRLYQSADCSRKNICITKSDEHAADSVWAYGNSVFFLQDGK